MRRPAGLLHHSSILIHTSQAAREEYNAWCVEVVLVVVRGEVRWHNCVCLFCALHQLGNVQVCYVIFTSFSLRLKVEPMWLVAGSPAVLFPFSQDNRLFDDPPVSIQGH